VPAHLSIDPTTSCCVSAPGPSARVAGTLRARLAVPAGQRAHRPPGSLCDHGGNGDYARTRAGALVYRLVELAASGNAGTNVEAMVGQRPDRGRVGAGQRALRVACEGTRVANAMAAPGGSAALIPVPRPDPDPSSCGFTQVSLKKPVFLPCDTRHRGAGCFVPAHAGRPVPEH
jgi:hypothetical protein